ncbi:hypothetical protein GCM10009557_47490 [Virgisporangium ochraceum]
MGRSAARNLKELGEYAGSVLERVRRTPQHPELDHLRTQLAERAEALARQATQVVTVAVWGEFSVGKSLLLGTLLGNPVLLPVSAIPTTCNVVLLRLRQSEDGPAVVQEAAVEWFTDGDLDSYVDHLAYTATQEAHLAAVTDLVPADMPRGATGVAPLRAAVTAVADRSDGLSRLRGELDRLHAALAHRPTDPGPETLSLDELPLVVAHPGASVDPPDARGLRSRLPLVRRVVLDVAVPVGVWNLAELHGAQVQFVDLPGSSGGTATIRDEFLAAEEVGAVAATLVVLDANRGAATKPQQLRDILRRHGRPWNAIQEAILVVGGKFDTLPSTPHQQVEDGVPVDLDSAADLRSLLEAARGLLPAGGDERIAFVSPLVTVAVADADGGPPWRAADVTRAVGGAALVVRAAHTADQWTKVDRPAGTIGTALAEFTVDGGLRHLRAMVVGLVNQRGLALQASVATKVADELRAHEARLDRKLNQLGADLGAGDSAAMVRTALAALDRVLTDMVQDARSTLIDPYSGIGSSAPLRTQVVDDAADEVLQWPAWTRLLAAVDGGRVVARAASGGSMSLLGARRTVPLLVSDLAEPFAQACRTLFERVHRNLLDAVADWLATWEGRVASAMTDLAPLTAEPARAQVERLPDGDLLVAALEYVQDLSVFEDKVRELLKTTDAPTDDDVAAAFPLDLDRAFPWHPDSPQDDDQHTSQYQVLRYRRELVRAASDRAVRSLSELQAQVRELVVVNLEDFRNQFREWQDRAEALGRAVDSTGT